MNNIKIALVHDWFVTIGGAEKVVSEILAVFPDADVYSIISYLPDDKKHFLRYKKVRTSFVTKLPFVKKVYRIYLPFMTYAIEQFDLSEYDVIISSSHAVAKGVITNPNQLHICYCHTPMRYAWDLQHQYLQEDNTFLGIKNFIMRWMLHKIRIWDLRTINGVDYFISNSNYIGKRIHKCYRRESTTIYPNVEVETFVLNKNGKRKEFYLTASRFVPYKKIDIIVKAFKGMPDKKLVVIGDGPQFSKVKKIATKNVEILGYKDNACLIEYMQHCKAFIFAAEEDFGITPVEAQACGAPVIAYGKGGALETIIDLEDSLSPTGVFFYEQTEKSIIEAVNKFEDNIYKFIPENCSNNAIRFSASRFRQEIYNFVAQKSAIHFPKYKKINSINTQLPVKVSLCIPTLNAASSSANTFLQTLQVIKSANLHRVLIIDSTSKDNTLDLAHSFGFETMQISRSQFDHGGTRQQAARILSDSDYIIYITQDVLINDKVALENLIYYTISNNLSAAYGRQVPHYNANSLAKHLRKFNYGESSYTRSMDKDGELSIKHIFASNSFSIYKLADLMQIGGFPEVMLLGEDMYTYSKLLTTDKAVGYCAESVVWHSHNYSIVQDFKRYFDIGVFHSTFTSILQKFGPPEKEGVKFARSELLYLLRYNVFYIPSFIFHLGAKYIGYKLGLYNKKLGPDLCQKFSMHPHCKFWKLLRTNNELSDRR
ncbi:MAG: alpha-D-mannose-alpha(1-6)phosphatidyl myo-inositol monomannoside transferase, partial [Burkholderiales bacterium]|jgi:glycosyltransferase involved in cell wall biosynthesis|nr:alpha-D-mannose-alpha(1-6)phosphatidyl myo-inositol monomannoside transferase [Burkholderiales bacterium]